MKGLFLMGEWARSQWPGEAFPCSENCKFRHVSNSDVWRTGSSALICRTRQVRKNWLYEKPDVDCIINQLSEYASKWATLWVSACSPISQCLNFSWDCHLIKVRDCLTLLNSPRLTLCLLQGRLPANSCWIKSTFSHVILRVIWTDIWGCLDYSAPSHKMREELMSHWPP